MKFQMACRAAEKGMRCRVMVDGEFCDRHQGWTERAPQPDVILIKFFGLKEELAILTKDGVRVVPYKSETEEKHRQQAQEYGVDFYQYRQTLGDSGTAVFGKKGARFISVADLIIELMNAGYNITDCHIKEKADQSKVVVTTFTFTQEEQEESDLFLDQKAADIVLNLLTTERIWGKVDVWANPPRQDGEVIHTVNCHSWGKLEPRQFINCLVFQEGLWGIEQKPNWRI